MPKFASLVVGLSLASFLGASAQALPFWKKKSRAAAGAPVPASAPDAPASATDADHVEQRWLQGFRVETRLTTNLPTGFYKTRFARRDQLVVTPAVAAGRSPRVLRSEAKRLGLPDWPVVIQTPEEIQNQLTFSALEPATLTKPLRKSEWSQHPDQLSCVLRQGQVVRDILESGLKGRPPVPGDVGETRESLRTLGIQNIFVDLEPSASGSADCKFTLEACSDKAPELRIRLLSSDGSCRVCLLSSIQDAASRLEEKCQKAHALQPLDEKSGGPKPIDVNAGFDEVYGSESRARHQDSGASPSSAEPSLPPMFPNGIPPDLKLDSPADGARVPADR
jgi:hypothetical protein